MATDLAALLATQADLRDTAPSTTIVPRRLEINEAIGILEQMAGAPLLASVQLKLGGPLGEGGMGVVRQAEQIALGRTVAVKTLKEGMRTQEAAEALLREAWITGSLEHPNVVPVHHLGLDDGGMPALVLKRVEGIEWRKLLDTADDVKRRYGATDLLAWNLGILLQVLNAIRFAHSRGILHRDLKPANVMIGDFGEVYLLDWGIAVSMREDESGRLPLARDAKQIAGTPCYMAPEMLQPDGDHPLSERTDIYLLGAVLFEIVTGHPPHAGKTALEVMASVLESRPQLPDDVPSELAAICARAMDPDPDERFASAEELRLALQGFLEHRGSDQILVRARARLDELAAVLAQPFTDRARHREDVYRLFGACRFGFHEALAAWRDNAGARAGLRRATIAVAEYELATGDAHAAVALLTDLDEPPALLAQAREAAAKHADRQRALEELDFAHDLAVGRRQRGKLGTTLGFFFVGGSVASALLPATWIGYWTIVAWSVGFIGVTALWTWLGRAELMTTIVNRRLISAVVFMLLAQLVLVLCTWRVGIRVEQTFVLMLFLYFVVAGCAASMIDRRLAPTAIGYGVACVIAALHPHTTMWLSAASNFVFALNTLYAWRLPHK
jgi:serine/threonine-protein kinase